MLIAPYNNSMRLGQGFNSYTQQICLDKAVTIDPTWTKNEEQGTRTLNHSYSEPRASIPQTAQDQNDSLIDNVTRFAAQDNNDTPETEKDSAGEPGKDKLIGVSGKIAARIEKEMARERLLRKQKEAKEVAAATAARNEIFYGTTGKVGNIDVPGWVKPQIVTYSSRFVDKLSDITDAMNISGSVSIKTATIGGKANGSYVDSDKFKSSDINYHLQVRVANQIHNAPEYSVFNDNLGVHKSKFPEVYGDCFISGWEEGGELNAIISMKVMDKSKIFEIKAGLEAELATGAIAGKVEGEVALENNKLSKQTETTIAISWSGGGSIKDPREDWSISSLKAAAAAFPDLVAITPQRTYAILTKYTALENFQTKNKEYSPLSYDNAGIYTGALLDAYMDYKNLWKQISIATYELEGNRASIEMGQPSEDVYALAKIESIPKNEAEPTKAIGLITAASTAPSQSAGDPVDEGDSGIHLNVTSQQVKVSTDEKSTIKFEVFPASFAGLIQARKVCRFEMAKIVNEVDLVSRNPSLATDTRRDHFFLNPLVYKQLLPIVRSLSPESEALGAKDPAAALLLGYLQPVMEDSNLPPLIRLQRGQELDPRLEGTFFRLKSKAHDYQLQGCAGSIRGIHSGAKSFNDLQSIDGTYRPIAISVWADTNGVQGLKILYASQMEISHGNATANPTHSLDLASDGSEAIIEVEITQDDLDRITSIKFATSQCNILDTSIPKNADTAAPLSSAIPVKNFIWTKPDEQNWSLRGFFGFTFGDGTSGGSCNFSSLGVVWGKDGFVPVPTRPIRPALSKSLLSLNPAMQASIRDITDQHPQYLGKFLMGNSVTTGATTSLDKIRAFNALPQLDLNWAMESISFAAKDKVLTGLLVRYTNGRKILHGAYADEDCLWTAEVKSDLVVARLTAGKLEAGTTGYIDTVEFVRGEAGGNMPAWPLNLSTLRYIGFGTERVKLNISEVVESAPQTGKGVWSVRGFYGEESEGVIIRLGVIWGRG